MAVVIGVGLFAAGANVALGLGVGFFTAFAIGAGAATLLKGGFSPNIPQQMAGTTVTVRDPAVPRKIIYGRVRVGGAIIYVDHAGTDNEYLHLVIAIAGHAIDGYEEVYLNDKKVWDGGSYVGSWGTYVHIGFHDGTQTTADSTLVNASTNWTTDHKVLGTAYLYVRLKYDPEQFPTGAPNVTAVVRGKKVYNPANSTTEWSQNPALIIRDFLINSDYGLGESASNINASSVTAAQTICDQTISLSAGGTQKRYVCDGVIDTSNSIGATIESLTSSMAGKVIPSGGEYFLQAGSYVTPTVTLDESVMVGALAIKTKQSRRSIYNGVKGVFLSEENNYNLADYPSIISSTYSAADGDPIYLDMPLQYTTNNIRAQRLAKLALLKSRQQTQITVPCNLAALKFKCGDNIMITNAKMGWSSKVFEVTGYSLDNFDDAIVVNVDAIETASDLYNWQSSDELDYLTGGEVSLYDGTTVVAPSPFSGTASTAINADGAVVLQIISTWGSSADVFVERYEFQWSTDNTNWNSIDVTGNQHTISPVIGGATYYTRIRAINNLGVRSAWATANIVAIVDTTPPGTPTNTSIVGTLQHINLAWTNPTDADFSHIEIKRSGTSIEGDAVSIDKTAGNTYSDGPFSLQATRYYWIRSVDRTGNGSAWVSLGSATSEMLGASDFTEGLIDFPFLSPAVQADELLSRIVDESLALTALENLLATYNDGNEQRENFAQVSNTVQEEVTARKGAIASLRTELIALYNNNAAAIVTEQTARANADSALASDITALTTTVGSNTSAITAEQTARANGDTANANSITALTATVNIKARTFYQDDAPTATATGDLWVDTNDGNKLYRWNGSAWQSAQDGGIATNAAAIVTEASARATADTAIADDVTALTTTVGGHTTSIATNLSSINGVKALHTVTINNNGHVTGYGLASDIIDGNPTSQFKVAADQFVIAGSGSATDTAPFVVYTQNTSVTVDGETFTIPAGAYINAGYFNYVNATDIKTGELKADRIEIDGQSIDSGSNGLQIKDLGVDTLQIKDQAVTLPVGANTSSVVYQHHIDPNQHLSELSHTTFTHNGRIFRVPVIGTTEVTFKAQELTINVSANNVPVFITFTGEILTNIRGPTGANYILFEIFRDSTSIKQNLYRPVGNLSASVGLTFKEDYDWNTAAERTENIDDFGYLLNMSHIDTAATAGSHNYSVRYRLLATDSSPNFDNHHSIRRNCTMTALEIKK